MSYANGDLAPGLDDSEKRAEENFNPIEGPAGAGRASFQVQSRSLFPEIARDDGDIEEAARAWRYITFMDRRVGPPAAFQ